MSLLIDLAFNNSYSEYFKEILSGKHIDKPYVNNFDKEALNFNLLDHSFYLIDSLELFLSSIKNRGYEINQGPQK